MNDILVIAPHPDDETLGCGGTLLRHRTQGDRIHWLIATAMHPAQGYPQERIERRTREINRVAERFGFESVQSLNYPAASLDTIPRGELVGRFKEAIEKVMPAVVYLPWRHDAHSDHQQVFDAAAAVLKSFRAPYVRRVLCYETLSETGFGMDPAAPAFQPNVLVDISDLLQAKLEIMALYEGELSDHPFPRSEKGLTALATLRGASACCTYAEGFLLLKERL